MSNSDRSASDAGLEETPVSLEDRPLPVEVQEEITVSDGELEDRPESEIDTYERTDSEKSLEDYGPVSDYDEDAPFEMPTDTYNNVESEDDVARDAAAEYSDEDVVPSKKIKRK